MADNTTLNVGTGGDVYASDDIAGVKHQRVKLRHGDDGVNDGDVSRLNPLPVEEGRVYAYDAGTATGTVDVPAAALLRRVTVMAGVSVGATVTIGGGDTITIPAGGAFDEQIPGRAVGADVVIGGTIQAYYVAWAA